MQVAEGSTPGSFYFFAPKSPSLGSWLLQRQKSEKIVHERLDSVLSSWEDDAPPASGDSTGGSAPSSLTRQGSLPQQTQSYVYKHAGLSVKVGLEEVASELYRVKPYVYSAPDHAAVVVFSGCLRNLSELLRRQSPRAPSGRGRGGAAADDPNNALERRSSLERSLDVGAATAQAVLGLYQASLADGGGGNELIMLSELQGEYAFVIYDNKRKQAFAARDPSGDEPLYYHMAEDGALSFSSSRLAVPDGEQPHEWRALPPGHYISGRSPRLHQFALTPRQLALREAEQDEQLSSDSGGGGYPGSARSTASAGGRRRLSFGGGGGGGVSLEGGAAEAEERALAEQLQQRGSLDYNDRLLKHKSLDADVFSLDL